MERVLFMRRILACILIAMFVTRCSVKTEESPSLPALSLLSTPESSQRLIVFVHGVFGDPSGTWTNPSGQSWAELMKGDDAFHGFTLATYRYDTPLRGRTSGIEEVATRLLRQLED